MMWYEIPGIPGYRINLSQEIMSLQGEWPVVLRKREKVRLLQDGRQVTFTTQELWDLVSIGTPLQGRGHHEARRDCCDQGHEFTPENTMRRKGKDGDIRKCRKCHNDAVNRYRRKKRRETRPPAPGG